MKYKSVYILITTCLAIGSVCFVAAANERDEVEVRGMYLNKDYAYAARLPDGLVGFREPAPMPNHGFVIPLQGTALASIWVDASYNSSFLQSPQEAVDAHIDSLREKSVTQLLELAREQTWLDRQPASRVVLSYRDISGTAMIEEIVLGIREPKKKAETQIIYTIGLRTSEARAEKDRAVFNRIRKSFTFRPLP